MSGFRTGKFDIEQVPGYLRPFAPVQAIDSILDIDPAALAAAGKKLILLDVDNTLVVWRGNEIDPEVQNWIDRAKLAGMNLCLLSNTRNHARLKNLSERFGIQFAIGKFKPSRYLYRKAMQEFGAKPSESVMIGDQLFTDILGANRSGIEAIWVRQMAPRDLITTKVSRMGERVVRRGLYRALEPDELPIGGAAAIGLLGVPVVRQFIKFCIVGGSSTVIDKGLLWVLMFYVHSSDGGLMSTALGNWLTESMPFLFSFAKTPDEAAVPVLNIFTAGLAILNSFVWNRRWTFKIRGKENRSVQLQKFFVVALIGFVLNVAITSVLHTMLSGGPERSLAIASLVATIAVAFWNFTGQKLWTFRHK